MTRAGVRWLGTVLLVAMIAAACSSDRDDDTTQANTDTGSATTEAKSGEATFGDMASPCGEGDAKGATEQGVTDEKIVIGFGDDAGFPTSPGLNHEQSDAIRAVIDWCNEQGGINGREIEGKYYDAKITEVNNVMLDACQAVFMLVGQGFSLDSLQEETRVGCKLASVPAWSVSPEFAHGPLMVQPVPNPVDFTPVQNAAAIAKEFPEKIKKTAVMFANYPATIDTKDKVLVSYPPFGFEFLDCPQQYNITGEPDWKPFVQKLKECGAEVVYFTGSPFPNYVNFLEAASQLKFEPIFITDANFYSEQFGAWNKDGLADNTYVRQAFIPLEEADDNKAVADYLAIVEKSGGDVSQLGEQAMSAFLLWATGAKACGSELTRDCVIAEIEKLDEWTGGGMHAPTDPGENQPPECGLTLKMEGTKYVRFAPTEKGELDCDPDYLKPVSGPVVERAELGPDRVSTKYLAS